MYLKSGLFVLVSTLFMMGSSSARMLMPFGYAYVASGSMEPALPTGAWVFFKKISPEEAVSRGDIVLFNAPMRFAGGNQIDRPFWRCKAEQFFPLLRVNEDDYKKKCAIYVKRIIGLPGDHVVAGQDCRVIINGKEYEEPYIYVGNNSYCPYDNVTLGEDQYYSLGDNRPSSYDSRIWGALPRNQIIGKAVYLFQLPFRIQLLNN